MTVGLGVAVLVGVGFGVGVGVGFGVGFGVGVGVGVGVGLGGGTQMMVKGLDFELPDTEALAEVSYDRSAGQTDGVGTRTPA
ncbi:MAG TPA: hypothetical protein VEV13_07295 [Candidatus Limnocylindria bacterium]|nr:hypothetical protein [Candidatus Limnocylindria bacterium]